MLRVQKLGRPNKHSGHPLAQNESTKVRGLVVTNTNSFTVFVDKFTRKKSAPKKKAAKKKVTKKK